MASAYEIGFREGTENFRKDRVRRYETNYAERTYWLGYLEGVKKANPGKMVVRCEREGKVFAVSPNATEILCPTCGRTYIKEGKDFVSDRKLTILFIKEPEMNLYLVYEDGICVMDVRARSEAEAEAIYRKERKVHGDGNYYIEAR